MNRKVLIIFLTLLSGVNIYAKTLKENVVEVLNTHPIVLERLSNFHLTQQELNVAKSDFYPSLDLHTSTHYNFDGKLNGDVKDENYGSFENTLTFTYNLFNGFANQNNITQEQARVVSSAYNYLEQVNDITFKMSKVYIDVMKTLKLLDIAKENVNINQEIYEKVSVLYDSGFITESEVQKIQGSLALARSNYTVKKNDFYDAQYSARRVLGRMLNTNEMKHPTLSIDIPKSIQEAALYAITHNPSMLVGKYKIKATQALYKMQQQGKYPKIDFEAAHRYNDSKIPDDNFKVGFVLSYNIYDAGKKEANTQKFISQIHQEVQNRRDLKRQVIEGLDLSWSSYEMVGEQLHDLIQYRDFSKKTLELYKEEYNMGRKSLLDLLSAQEDFIKAKSQIVEAHYDKLFAKYRILDAMGLLTSAIIGDDSYLKANVNLDLQSAAKEVKDLLPIKYDADNDKISDNADLCDNSLDGRDIMLYGCQKHEKHNIVEFDTSKEIFE